MKTLFAKLADPRYARIVRLTAIVILMLAFTAQSGAKVGQPQSINDTPWPVCFPIGPDAFALGVTDYECVRQADGAIAVRFGHRNMDQSGEVRIRKTGEGMEALLELVRKGDSEILILWNPDDLRVWLEDANGTGGFFVFDAGARGWKPATEGAESILHTNQEDVKIVAAVYGDFQAQPVDQPTRVLTTWRPVNLLGRRADSEVYCPCTGPWSRGDAVHTTRSGCCYAATNDVNVRCWNQWCIGCCQLGDCDAACLIEDYFCVCGRSGRECGGPCY